MSFTILNNKDINHLLQTANAIGRGVNSEVNDSQFSDMEKIILQLMIAELITVNVMRHFSEHDPEEGHKFFNDIHLATQQIVSSSNIVRGNNGPSVS